MNDDLVQQAHSKLIIREILLHSGEIKTSEDFFPFEKKAYEIQFKQYIKDSNLIKVDDEDFILFHYVAGFRALPTGLSDEEKENDLLDKVVVEVTAIFSAIYKLIEEIPEEAVVEFAKFNVGFNVWPFWRE